MAVTPYKLLDSCDAHGAHLKLFQRGEEYSIVVPKEGELMNSRVHNSEDVLAEIACKHISKRKQPTLLVGGLGMGYTLRAALNHANSDAALVVAELMPAVVRWNREHLGGLADFPLEDERVSVMEMDVAEVMKSNVLGFDAIMMDVDNGPDGFMREDNDDLYGYYGLNLAYAALKPGGVMTVWSAGTDKSFTQRLMKVGFDVQEQSVHAQKGRKGSRHHIWTAVRRS